jgi:uncharacterized protein (DUF488 family)
MRIYTIGHSNVSFEEFVGRVQKHGILTLVDVRSAPYSQYTPHFNHDYLENHLPASGIDYIYMGDKLGGRPRSQLFQKPDGTPDYEKMAAAETFQEGLGVLKDLACRSEVCILCSEEDPAKCHRSKLVSKQLALAGVEVAHILGDGSLESEEDNAKRRVSAKEKQLDMF